MKFPKRVKSDGTLTQEKRGYKANERPVSFVLDDQKMEVKEIVKQWVGQYNDYFKVLADDGLKYKLKWNRSLDKWFVLP